MSLRLVQGDTLSIVDEAGEPVFSITEQFDEPRATLHVAGRITLEVARQFEDELTSLVTVCSNILIDFTDTEYISTEGMQCLIELKRIIGERDGASLVMCGINESLMKCFKEAGIDDVSSVEGQGC